MELCKLKEPFTPCDIEWRIQQSGCKNGRPWAMCLAYVTNRAIMERLDEVCGPENWKNEFKPAPDGGILCGISIFLGVGPNFEWVTKWDGASNTDIEAVKGGLSNSMKRAAVQWGIGRYLYKLDTGWAEFNDNGKYSAKIKDGNQPQYFKWNPPRLPDWALPKTTQPQTKPKKEKPSDLITKETLSEFTIICDQNTLDPSKTAEHYGIRFKENRMTNAEFGQAMINIKQDLKTGDIGFDLIKGEDK